MKNQQSIGSKKFWKVIAVMLAVFIVLAVLIVAFCSHYETNRVSVTEQTQITQSGELDHSYEAVRERVNSINENYGQGVKSSYYGETSTMERLMQQRAFFMNLKSLLIIVLLVSVILLVLSKGFGLALFKHRAVIGNAGEADKAAEEPKRKPAPATEKPKADAPAQAEPEKEVKEEPQSEESAAEEASRDADNMEVTENCQLP